MLADLIKASQQLPSWTVPCPGMIDGQMFITHLSLTALPDGKCHSSFLCSGRPTSCVRDHPVFFRTAQDDAAGVQGQNICDQDIWAGIRRTPLTDFFALTLVVCCLSLLKLERRQQNRTLSTKHYLPMRITTRILLAAGLFLSAVAGPAAAETDFPNRAIHIVLPYPAGGIVDIDTRTVTEK